MTSIYLIPNPDHPYAERIISEIWKKFGYKAFCFFTDVRWGFDNSRFYPFLNNSEMVEGYKGVPFDKINDFALYIKQNYDCKGVIPWQETTLEACADILDIIGNDWIPTDTLRIFRNKAAVKKHLRKQNADLVTPSYEISCLDDLDRLDLPKQFVIKPADGVSNQDIGFFQKDHHEQAVKDYFGSAKKFKNFILEPTLVGEEYAINGQIDQSGQVEIYSITHYERRAVGNKPNMYYYNWFLHYNDPAFETLTKYTKEVIAVSGLRRSPFHMEVIIDNDLGPKLIEIGARLVGDMLLFPTEEIHNYSFDPFKNAVHYYLSSRPLGASRLNWQFYNSKTCVQLYGVAHSPYHIWSKNAFKQVEKLPYFRRWVVNPPNGTFIDITTSLNNCPYSCHLFAEQNQEDLTPKLEKIRETLSPKSTHLFQKVFVYSRSIFKKIKLRIVFELKKSSYLF